MTDEHIVKEESKAQSELEMCQQKSDEYLNNWKRAAADLINYKKEEMGRVGLLVNYTKEDMIYKILPVLDSIYLAQQSLPPELQQNPWTAGFLQIQNQITGFLKKEGVEPIEVIGQKFDPNTMESVGEVEASFAEASAGQRAESGIVVEELQKGYKMGDRVLRPAKVKVSK